MNSVISRTQQRRVEKVERLRKYFGHDSTEVHGWSADDEETDFKRMSDAQVAEYLKKKR